MIDLDNIPILISCSQEQFRSQVSHAVSHLLRNEKPADLVPGRSDQRASKRRSEEFAVGAKGKGACCTPRPLQSQV